MPKSAGNYSPAICLNTCGTWRPITLEGKGTGTVPANSDLCVTRDYLAVGL